MTASRGLLDRLDAVLGDLITVLSSHNRLAVVAEVAACADQARPGLDAMCAEARTELDATLCLVTLLTDSRQIFIGVAGAFDLGEGTDVNDSLCQYVVATGASLQVDDTTTFCPVTPGLANMDGAGMHSYYGEPIIVRGQTIGSFCALDAEVRHWDRDDTAIVRRWADRAADHLHGLLT